MENKKEPKVVLMPVVKVPAAGIDVGSRSHYVTVGQGKEDARKFGVYDKDLYNYLS